MNNEENKSTHFIFDGEKIIISPDLRQIVVFLQGIEEEVNDFLNFENKLESIRKSYVELLGCVKTLIEKNNDLSFVYKFSEDPKNIKEKLIMHRPVRSEMLVLFAYLETLVCLSIAYENKTADSQFIIKKAMDQDYIKAFLKDLCLNENNSWCKNNKERLKHITADNIRKLRNSLTHFFSVSKDMSISFSGHDGKSRRLEKATNFKVKFLSSEDLHGILRGVTELMIEKWSDDCKKCLLERSDDFKEKILSVNKVIENDGSIIVNSNQINI